MADAYYDYGTHVERRRNVSLGGPVDIEAAIRRTAEDQEIARKRTEQHETKVRAERLALARAALTKTLDRLILVADIKAFAELGDIDTAFAAWKARKPKTYNLARLSALSGAIDGVKYQGAVFTEDRKVTLPDAVIDEAAETLRLEILSAIEAITPRV